MSVKQPNVDLPEVQNFWVLHSDKSDSHLHTVRKSLELFEDFISNENIKFEEVEGVHIVKFIQYLQDTEGYAGSTTRTLVSALNPYFDHVRESMNPMHSVSIQGHTDGAARTANVTDSIKWLDLDEIDELLNACNSTRERLIIGILWQTGVRISELVNITREDLDRPNRRIQIQTKKKDKEQTRTVYYSRSFRSVMRAWLDRGARDKYAPAGESIYLLPTSRTEQMDVSTARQIFYKVANRADLQENITSFKGDREAKKLYPHVLRHSFAIHSLRGQELSGTEAMDVVTLRDLMGHSRTETTSLYLNFTDRGKQQRYDRCHPA